MNDYQHQQLDAQRLVRTHLRRMATDQLRSIEKQVAPYLDFRRQVDQFLNRHCQNDCTRSCFESRMSACCSRDGIVTFWADLVVNAICSDMTLLDRLQIAIQSPRDDHKCIYLGDEGCIWRVRPLVCAMFLCDRVKQALSKPNGELAKEWSRLEQKAKGFRWPDRPVLFDLLEQVFIQRGCQSELMYLNNSPGLLRVKQKAGLV